MIILDSLPTDPSITEKELEAAEAEIIQELTSALKTLKQRVIDELNDADDDIDGDDVEDIPEVENTHNDDDDEDADSDDVKEMKDIIVAVGAL